MKILSSVINFNITLFRQHLIIIGLAFGHRDSETERNIRKSCRLICACVCMCSVRSVSAGNMETVLGSAALHCPRSTPATSAPILQASGQDSSTRYWRGHEVLVISVFAHWSVLDCVFLFWCAYSIAGTGMRRGLCRTYLVVRTSHRQKARPCCYLMS